MNCPKCQCDHCKWEREFIARAFDPTKCVSFPVQPAQWSQWPTTAAPAPPPTYVVRDTPAGSNGTGD